MSLQNFSKHYGGEESFLEILAHLFHLPKVIDKEIWFQAFNESFPEKVNPSIQSFDGMLDFIQRHKNNLSELYLRGVGEAGLPPTSLYQMSPAEIDLAYMGYLKRQELQANLALLVQRKAKDKEAQLFNLLGGEGYSIITPEEKEQQLADLGLK